MSEDLSGEWIGTYSYPGEIEPVQFRATLIEGSGLLSGETSEPGQTPTMGEVAHALIQGVRSGSRVSFTKVYDSVEDDPVLYDGTVDAEGTEIEGNWTIIGQWSGSFLMKRAKGVEQEAEAEESVDA